MDKVEIRSPISGLVGYVNELEFKPDSVIVIQLPRPTNMLSDVYLAGAMDHIKKAIPEGRKAIVIGSDVNIYDLAGEDAVALKLKGILL